MSAAVLPLVRCHKEIVSVANLSSNRINPTVSSSRNKVSTRLGKSETLMLRTVSSMPGLFDGVTCFLGKTSTPILLWKHPGHNDLLHLGRARKASRPENSDVLPFIRGFMPLLPEMLFSASEPHSDGKSPVVSYHSPLSLGFQLR